MKAAAPQTPLEHETKNTKKTVVGISDVEPSRPIDMAGDVRRAETVPAERLPPGELFATTATAADHPDIFHFLTAVLQRPLSRRVPIAAG